MSTPGIGAGGTPSPIRPPARPAALEARAAAAAAAPANEAQVAQAKDALSSAGLDLRIAPGAEGTDLSGLVDEVALDPSMGSLGRGSDPAAVSALQGTLNALGAEPPLTVDGAYGPATTAAVRAFQEKLGLSADGVAGPNTIRALQAQEALAMAAASPAGEEGPFLAQAEALIAELPEGQQAVLRAELGAVRAQVATEAAALAEAASEAAPAFEENFDFSGAMDPGATGVVSTPDPVVASPAPAPMPEPGFQEDFNWNGDPAAAPVAEAAPVVAAEAPALDLSGGMDLGATGVVSTPDPVVASPAPAPMPEPGFQEDFNWNGDPAAAPVAEAAPEVAPAEAAAPAPGPSREEALAEVTEAWENSTLGELVGPEWLAQASDEVVQHAFDLMASEAGWSDAEAATAAELAATLATRHPEQAPALIDGIGAGYFNEAVAAALSPAALTAVLEQNPEWGVGFQASLGEEASAKVELASAGLSEEASLRRAYESQTANGITNSEAQEVARLAASLGNADPSRLPGLMEQFNRDQFSYGPFIEALWAQANPALRQAIAHSGVAEGYIDAALLEDAAQSGPGPF